MYGDSGAVHCDSGAVYGDCGAVYGDLGAVYGDSGAVYGDCGAVYDVLNHLEGSTTYSSTEGTRVDKLFRGSGNSYVKSCINVYNNLKIFQCG